MTARSPLLYLSEMYASMEKVGRYIAGLSFDDFRHQEQLIDAVERNIEKIGEAAAAVPDDIRKRHPEVPGKAIVGMRNKVIHHYFAVDPEVICQIATKNIPETRDKIAETGMNRLISHGNNENARQTVSKHRNYDSPRPVRRLIGAHGGQVG